MQQPEEPIKRRVYSDREKAEALALLDTNDGNFYRTAQQSGIPRSVLQHWAKGGGLSADVPLLRQQKTLEYGGRFGELLEVILDSVSPEDLRKASLKDKFISAAVAFDKRQLAYGQPTQLTEHRVTVAVIYTYRRLIELGRPPDEAKRIIGHRFHLGLADLEELERRKDEIVDASAPVGI
jgi:hypothetical protein